MPKDTFEVPIPSPRMIMHYGSRYRETAAQGTVELGSRRTIDGQILIPEGEIKEAYVEQNRAAIGEFGRYVQRAVTSADAGNINATEESLREVQRIGIQLRLEGVDGFVKLLKSRAAGKR